MEHILPLILLRNVSGIGLLFQLMYVTFWAESMILIKVLENFDQLKLFLNFCVFRSKYYVLENRKNIHRLKSENEIVSVQFPDNFLQILQF